jgi:2-C-methyl-D-erythritol 4-phosphate cytidylyltransferase
LKQKVFAILTAAGTGKRFSGSRFSGSSSRELPKQFQRISDKPVLYYPLIALNKSRAVSGIFISSIPEHFENIHAIAAKYKITKLMGLVEGGKTRFESVRNAFMQIDCRPNDLILIHDAARPNISVQFVNELIECAVKYGEIIPGCKVSETVKRVRSGIVKQTIDRSDLWSIQTPQIFRHKVLLGSYQKAKGTSFTDEASLVESCGYKVRIAEGRKTNIKITLPEDLTLLKKIMK